MKKPQPILTIQLFDSHLPIESENNASPDAVIVRADHMQSHIMDPKVLSHYTGKKVYTLRSIREGGAYADSLENRHTLLRNARHMYNFIELEAETDLTPEILATIPPEQRIISWKGQCNSLQELQAKLDTIKQNKASYYQLIVDPFNLQQCILPLELLIANPNLPLISYASGAIGIWTQILSAYLGSQMVKGCTSMNNIPEAYLTIDQLVSDYNLPTIRQIDQIYGITGNPIFSSLSPQIHNKCYELLGMNALYLPFHVEEFDQFWKLISLDIPASRLKINLGGFTMVSPYKEDTFAKADGHLCSPTLASRASNILVNKQGQWFSDSSDGLGALAALHEKGIQISNLRIAIIGCGGAGRTIASRLKEEGAEIFLFNRSQSRGRFAANLLQLPFLPLSELAPEDYDIVINATPVGKHGKKLIYDPKNLRPSSIAIDMAYSKTDTMLVNQCHQHDKNIIEGKEILLHQVKKQFSCLTGRVMPYEVELMVREKTANQLVLR